jgi:hypothetical protein
METNTRSNGGKQHFLCTPELSGLRWRTVRDRAAGLSKIEVGLSAGQNPKNTLTRKCFDLGREHNGGLSAGYTGLSVGQSPENKPRRIGSGLCSTVNGELSGLQLRTVHSLKTQKHTEEEFWTPFREQRWTVRALGPDCPQVKRQKTSSETTTLNSRKPDVRTLYG